MSVSHRFYNVRFIDQDLYLAPEEVQSRGVATGGISVYISPPQKKISLPYKFLYDYWLLFFLFDWRSSYSARGTLTCFDFEIGMTS